MFFNMVSSFCPSTKTESRRLPTLEDTVQQCSQERIGRASAEPRRVRILEAGACNLELLPATRDDDHCDDGRNRQAIGTGSNTESLLNPEQNFQPEDRAVFASRFSRCYRLLHFIACRVLGSPQRAKDAIESCWLTASRNPPRFEYEGAFRSWLVRVLIDAALGILRWEGKSAQPCPKE